MSERHRRDVDHHPLCNLGASSGRCLDCFSSLSALVAVLDLEGRVVYGNAAFAAAADDWRAGVGDPRPIAEVWPLVMADLPDVEALRDEREPVTRVRETQLDPDAENPRDHLVFLDPIREDATAPPRGWALTLVDISHIRQAERSSRDILAIEMFLARLSARFVGEVDVDAAIETSLAEIGQMTEATRVFFATWTDRQPDLESFLAWQREHPIDPRESLAGHGALLRPWYESLFDIPETVEIDDLRAEVPDDIQDLLRRAGDDLGGSLLIVPLMVGDRLTGVVGIRYAEHGAAAGSSAWVALDIFCHILERVIQLKRSEEALRTANRELKQTSAQLVQSEKMASIGQMAAGVAHEINNPVGFIMSNLATLRDHATQIRAAVSVCRSLDPRTPGLDTDVVETLGALDNEDLAFIAEDLDDLIAESLEGCDRVRDIVHNLKGFARSEESGPAPTDLNECVQSTLKIVWNELKYRCDVIEELGDLPPVTCSAGKINQVIMNLLVNAAHAIDDRGTITIRTWSDEAQAMIAVEDTGRGIPTEDRHRLFDPFFTTKDPGKGTGLGLYICHSIIEEHGGDIAVSSTVGIGSTFTVRLPLTPVDQPREETLVIG
ncbi:hypothetical protein GF314_03020 [bacterium]|nr:hypothetical protein [bacterium]